jgi:phospholipid/cholesterol/gamma-HCH transport system ATP-binding protein
MAAPSDTDTVIEAQALSIGYGAKVIQGGLDFGIRRGEIFVLMGGSGCGKSTLMRALIGLQPPLAGRVRVGGESLYDADDERLAALRRRFGVMFQQGALFSSMTVGDNVALPLKEFTVLPPDAIDDIVRYKLALVGLDGTAPLEPAALSGGMRKRAAIARAMALDPAILFLDEPSAGLDPISSARLDELILRLRDSLGTTVVLVTHELDSIEAVADRALFLDAQRKTMLALGHPATLRAEGPPEVREFLAHGKPTAND